jgi:hypothetical protein
MEMAALEETLPLEAVKLEPQARKDCMPVLVVVVVVQQLVALAQAGLA